MKTNILFCALLIGGVAIGQTTKTVTVRYKKIEDINGVRKVTDTTFTTSDPAYTNGIKVDVLTGSKDGGDKIRKIDIITDEVHGEDKPGVQVIEGRDIDRAELEAIYKKAGINPGDKKCEKKVIIEEQNIDANGHQTQKRRVQVYVVKNINISEPDKNETAMLKKATGVSNNTLSLNELNVFPNPANGKFNLMFSLPEAGSTEISILDSGGKKIYNEKIADFNGSYNKEIELAKYPNGIYFLKIDQGGKTQVKKIVLE